MINTVFCQKLNEQAEALDQPPYPGDLGQRVFQNISKQAWGAWLNHQTMLINEYRLSVIEPSAREFLENEMVKFLFNDDSELPAGFVTPVDNKN